MVGASSRLLFLLTNPVSLLHQRPFALFRLTRRHFLTSLSAAPNHLLRRTRNNSLIPIKFSQKIYSRATSYALQENNHIPADGYHVPPSHPWPEWFRLLESLSVSGYFNGNSNFEDALMVNENLSMEFVGAANSCLAFARDRPDILGWLPKKTIEVLINNVNPFLFKSAHETERRMRAFLQAEGSNEATSVDLMKYILSYASNPERNINETAESSARCLLQEMANFIGRGQAAERYEQMPRILGPNITMKRGDWICPKCNFMNFARNTKCLECEDPRPHRQLTDGEWDCPRCNFFNYRKNMVCLKCECKRPDEAPSHGPAKTPSEKQLINSHYQNNYVQSSQIQDTDKEDKTERWFKKIKELHGVTDPISAVSHDDFPRIMPIRKEQNHFVDNKNKDRPVSAYERQRVTDQGNASGFVPFPPGYFAKKDNQQQPENTDLKMKPTNEVFNSNNVTGNQQMNRTNNLDSRSIIGDGTLFGGNTNSDSSSNHFRRYEPQPKGNRTRFSGNMNTDPFGNSFRRNESTPEGNRAQFRGDTNIDPFRSRDMNTDPFGNPFGLNEPKPKGNRTQFSGDTNTDPFSNQFRRNEPNPEDKQTLICKDTHNVPFRRNDPKPEGNKTLFSGDMNTDPFSNHFRRNEPKPEGNKTLISGATNTDPFSDPFRRNEPRPEINQSQQTPENMRGWTGKSLEGSAVTEPDPLDMSEEAKAERWFKRVAQIKDISELSQIPDEDFPSIMPMRKGVNRFVVSKRKTPLERRLTSPQYRKNLRIMSSDSMKKEGDDDN